MATTTPERSPSSPALSFYYRQFFEDPILRAFYGESGFGNLGYWDASTRSAGEAGERLIDELLGQLPECRGSVIDVACGLGGSTQRLCRYFEPAQITAIGSDPSQLEAAAARASGCRFLAMDATALLFPDQSFDNVLCVEAAFHFDTRERFLLEAARVLKPGGHLLVSDLCMAPGTPLVPSANYLSGASAYAELLLRCGFADVRARDVTPETWGSYRRRLSDFVLASASRFASPKGLRALLAANAACAFAIRSSLIAAARKPDHS